MVRYYNKYSNKKTTLDGISFDSKAEARRYAELKMFEKVGLIKNLVLQPKFELQESFVYKGKRQRAINYIADFAYFKADSDTQIVEDVKGVETEVFKLKKKLFLKKYPDVEFLTIGAD